MSLFITFEGGEGSGKSTQSRILYEKLAGLTLPAILTHEPGGTSLGSQLKNWLKWIDDKDIPPLTELLLFNASRSQLITEVIRPNLKSHKVVISDRYADSTIAYQGYGRGLDLATVKAVNDIATQRLKPDLTVLLDIPVNDGFTRKKGDKHDRFEQETLAFHQRVRKGFLKLAQQEPSRWLVIDATQSKDKIAQIIWQRVNQCLTIGR
ncbi:MAG: dTMP kinase [Dehalococcoidales bacterium]|nr:dTMP kinase [Dehalococcoidales bacterium]